MDCLDATESKEDYFIPLLLYVFHMLNHVQTVERSSTSHPKIVSGHRIGWIHFLNMMLLNILWLQNEQLSR